MPLIFRHLAAAVLPLSATAAGILAVGIAVQLPRGPATGRCAHPRRQPARAGSRCRRSAPAWHECDCSAWRTGVVRASDPRRHRRAPSRRPSAPPAPASSRQLEPTTAISSSPSPPRRPEADSVEEAAPLTPPVAARRRLPPRSPRSLPRPQARIHRGQYTGAAGRCDACRGADRGAGGHRHARRSTPRRKPEAAGQAREEREDASRRIRRSPAMEAKKERPKPTRQEERRRGRSTRRPTAEAAGSPPSRRRR